jgi:hypothetical protein
MIAKNMITTMARCVGVLLAPLAAKAAGFLTINSVMPPAPQHHLVMQRVAVRRPARHRALGTGR